MDIDRVDQIIDKHQGEASALIQVLLDIQSEHHWLPKQALARVSEKLQVPYARILHIATFYKAFSLVPKGRHEIQVCMGTACHVRGAPRVLDTVQDLTGIKLRGANLQYADLTGADLSNADLKDADLSYANLSGVRVEDADFSNCSLTGVDMTGAVFSRSNLAGAVLDVFNE